jgi:hypothetical protein
MQADEIKRLHAEVFGAPYRQPYLSQSRAKHLTIGIVPGIRTFITLIALSAAPPTISTAASASKG